MMEKLNNHIIYLKTTISTIIIIIIINIIININIIRGSIQKGKNKNKKILFREKRIYSSSQ